MLLVEEVRPLSRDFKHQRAEEGVSPRKPRSCVRTDGIAEKALVHQPCVGRCRDQLINAGCNLVVVVRSHSLHDDRHGPDRIEADVRPPNPFNFFVFVFVLFMWLKKNEPAERAKTSARRQSKRG